MLEAHYLLKPPHTIQRIDQDGVTDVPVPFVVREIAGASAAWGYGGSGAIAAAATLLLDSGGNSVPGELRIAAKLLVGELLLRLKHDEEHKIGIRELRAWIEAELPRRLAEGPPPAGAVRLIPRAERQESVRRFIEEGGHSQPSWFDHYRAEYGGVEAATY